MLSIYRKNRTRRKNEELWKKDIYLEKMGVYLEKKDYIPFFHFSIFTFLTRKKLLFSALLIYIFLYLFLKAILCFFFEILL